MSAETKMFHPANDAIIADIKKELRLQGHYLTGALEASLVDREIEEAGGITLTAEALGYLEDLEKGIDASLIDINSKSLAEMTRYVELRMGYRGSYAQKVAYAILRKQQKEGNPTTGSYAFTKTGERTKAVTETFEKNDNKYFGMIDSAAVGSLDESFNEIKSGTI